MPGRPLPRYPAHGLARPWPTAPWGAIGLLLVSLAWLAGCSSTPPRGNSPRPPAPIEGPAPWGERDGPGRDIPADLAQVPDAVPRVEPLRTGGPNKPYVVLGQRYEPEREDVALVEEGLASWYGRKFHGRRTANGEVYDMYAMTAAHKTMPLPSYARVRNPANGREVIVRINDRGPFHPGRVIDLSYTAALKLGVLRQVAPVIVERLTHDEIRAGRWARTDFARAEAAQPAAPAPVRSPAPSPAGGQATQGVARPADQEARVLALLNGSSPGAGSATAAARPSASPPAAPDAPDAPDASAAMASTAPSRPTSSPEPMPAEAEPPADPRGYWLQIGAYRARDGALDFRARALPLVRELVPGLIVFADTGLHRLQAGPWADRASAETAAKRLRQALQLVPALVERR